MDKNEGLAECKHMRLSWEKINVRYTIVSAVELKTESVMCVHRSPPVVPPLYAIEADGAVSSEQDDHVSEDIEQQSV